ncbi:MAG: hypothetical protein HW421_2727 [Ignavibacteria bacterium]|nr:hypothetical protein [Ignavibacteria bacterium]
MLTKDGILIEHIFEEASFLFANSQNISFNEFIGNSTLKRAFARSIEIIGEASKKLSSEFKNNNPQINWKAISGMRDKLIHDYFGVDYELVWNVATEKSIELINFIKSLNIDNHSQENLFS